LPIHLFTFNSISTRYPVIKLAIISEAAAADVNFASKRYLYILSRRVRCTPAPPRTVVVANPRRRQRHVCDFRLPRPRNSRSMVRRTGCALHSRIGILSLAIATRFIERARFPAREIVASARTLQTRLINTARGSLEQRSHREDNWRFGNQIYLDD